MDVPQAVAVSRPPSWFEYVRPYADLGLSSCISRGLLRLDGVRMAVTPIDVTATRIVEWSIEKRQSIVLLSPDPYDLLVPLTAAAVHVSRMLELQKKVGGYPHTDARVAVITTRIRLRSAYRRLGLGNAKLFEAVPAAMRHPTGNIAVLGRDAAHADWGTLFVERAAELRNVRGLSLVVVDLPMYDWDLLDSMPVLKIVVGHDPADRLVHRLARTLPVFAWDAKDLRGLETMRLSDGNALSAVAARLETLAAGARCSPMPVPCQAACENAALFWSDIGALHRAAQGSYLARELTAEAHELFQDLLHLSVPVSFYEEQTGRSFRVRLRDLQHDEFQTRGELRDLYLPMVYAELRDLAAALGEHPPKTDALMNLLREQVDRGRDVMLIARTATMGRVQRAYLAQFPELVSVRVTSLSEVGDEMPADVAVLTGLVPAWARHVYASGVARDIRVLAYSARAALVVHDPFVEAEYVRRTIAYQQSYTTWLARPAMKAKCWKALSAEDVDGTDDMPAPAIEASDVSFTELSKPPDIPPGLWQIGFPSVRAEMENGRQSSSIGDRATLVEGLEIVFDDGRWVILDHEGSVTRYSSVLQRADPGSDVAKLALGDQLVFLDGDAQKDVLAKVLEVAKHIPHLATSATWVEYWRDALRRGKQRFRTYAAFTDELHKRGCRREVQTVRLWILGATIGPSDRLDVQRVGDTLSDVPLRDHHETVYDGIEAFRGAHAQLMERIGALALHVGPAASSGAMRADQVIDERSGLTAADFQGCVEILKVRSIRPIGQVPLGVVGRLREPSNAETIQ